jgi:hypothetical protein
METQRNTHHVYRLIYHFVWKAYNRIEHSGPRFFLGLKYRM